MYSNRSSLSDGINNKTANNRYRITLNARAGSHDKTEPIQKAYAPISIPIPSRTSSPTPIIQTENHTESLQKMTLTSTSTLTPDNNYYSDQNDPIVEEYYDNVDEISIPSSKPLNNNNKYSPSKSPSSQSIDQVRSVIRSNEPTSQAENRPQYRFPEYSHSYYDQSTLKSFLMLSNSDTTEKVSFAKLLPTTTTTTTEKPTTTSRTRVSSPSARDLDVQRQKILSFIISENQPSSFKSPSTTTSTQKPSGFATNQNINSNNNYFNAFVNTQKLESTTISLSNTTSTNSPRSQISNQQPSRSTILLSRDVLTQNKTIRLTLSSSPSVPSRTFRGQILPQGTVEEIPLIRSRPSEIRQSLQLSPVEPTTYSPTKPYRLSNLDVQKSSALLPNDFDDEFDPQIHSRRRPYVHDLLTSLIPTRFPPRTTSTSEILIKSTSEIASESTEIARSTSSPNLSNFKAYNENVQSFTSRGLVFKEALNRTLEPQLFSKPIISPYTSLENQRLTNAIRTTTQRTNFNPSNRRETTSNPITTSTSQPFTPSTFRSYFLITAPIKNKTSTFLFPESSNLKTTSAEPTSETFSSEASTIASTENIRGRYRHHNKIISKNSIATEEPTTYAPRLRYNTRSHTMVDTVSTESPSSRRKVVRLKSSLQPPIKPIISLNTTDTNKIDVTTHSTKVSTDKFVASSSRDSSQFRPIQSKSNSFNGKLSHSSDNSQTTPQASALRGNLNYVPVAELRSVDSVVEITDKPVYFDSFNLNKSEQQETSTKKFRATVEMPEMNVPMEKIVNAFIENEESYDEADNPLVPLDIIESDYDREHEVDFAYVDSSTTSTTVAPSVVYDKIHFNTTYSTLTETSTRPYQPTTSILTSTSLQMTEPSTTSTTINPISLIPPRASRVNNAIKTSVAGLPRRNTSSASIKCNDISSNAKCNEIPSRYYENPFEINKTKSNSLTYDSKLYN